MNLIAILSNNRIGLFDMVYVDDDVVAFRGHMAELQAWVRPSATLYSDPQSMTTETASIHVYTDVVLRYHTNGTIFPNSVYPRLLTRIPYLVCFYDILDPYPVYMLNDDRILPWSTTLVAIVNYTRAIDEYEPSVRSTMPRVLSATAICPITLESLTEDDAIWTPCGHVFSHRALETALLRDNRCPLCRTEVQLNQCVF